MVINADAMQVYGDLRIITARPTRADEALVPHALYGTVDGATNYSVARWLADVEGALRTAAEVNLLPILVGGTGLYFKALTQGLSELPPIPEAVRAAVRSWAADRSAQAVHAELTRLDPRTAQRLRPTDPQRVTRALEVAIATGGSLAAFQAQRSPPLLGAGRCVGITLVANRTVLRERVDRRFKAMVREGALAEVGRLRERAVDARVPVMRALGVPPLMRHLQGSIDLATAVAEGQADSRRYLRRQDTFFRHQLPDFTPVEPLEAEEAIMRLRRQL